MEEYEFDVTPEITISPADLTFLKDLRVKTTMIISDAEKAQMKAKIAELEYKITIQEVYLKYGIAITDSVDETTGKVSKIKKEEPNE